MNYNQGRDLWKEHPSWGDETISGYYVGLAMHHYRNYKCYVPNTAGIHYTDTMYWPDDNKPLPNTNNTDKLHLEQPYPSIAFPNNGRYAY